MNEVITSIPPHASLMKNPKLNCKTSTGHINKVKAGPQSYNSQLSSVSRMSHFLISLPSSWMQLASSGRATQGLSHMNKYQFPWIYHITQWYFMQYTIFWIQKMLETLKDSQSILTRPRCDARALVLFCLPKFSQDQNAFSWWGTTSNTYYPLSEALSPQLPLFLLDRPFSPSRRRPITMTSFLHFWSLFFGRFSCPSGRNKTIRKRGALTIYSERVQRWYWFHCSVLFCVQSVIVRHALTWLEVETYKVLPYFLIPTSILLQHTHRTFNFNPYPLFRA